MRDPLPSRQPRRPGRAARSSWCAGVLACFAAATPLAVHAAAPDSVLTRRATAHPMRYHVALPRGWSAGRAWPVLVVIPDAARDFVPNLERFVRARGDRPYLLVAPEVLSCGGARTRTRDLYTYTAAEWDALAGGDDFAFEDAGLAAVLADVQREWHGEPRAFLTGWEAGGHTVWAQAFRHPERWRAVVPVSTNYQRRGVPAAAFSRAAARASLPIQPLRCGAPSGDAIEAVTFIDRQMAVALQDARDHGWRPRPVQVIRGADHGPLPDAVFAWCDTLRRR